MQSDISVTLLVKSGDLKMNGTVIKINNYLIVHVKHMLNIHASLLIVNYKVTISKVWFQNTTIK